MLEDEGPRLGRVDMGHSKQRFIDGVHTNSSVVAGTVIFQLILAVLNLNMIIGPVQAGTEDRFVLLYLPRLRQFRCLVGQEGPDMR